MQIIKAGYEVIDYQHSMNPIKKVERIARVCYKSEDKIGDGTAEKMVRALIKRNHTAMLEHASLVVEMDEKEFGILYGKATYLERVEGFKRYLRFTCADRNIVSGNIRAWREFLQECSRCHLFVSESLNKILRGGKYALFFEDISYDLSDIGEVKAVNPCSLVFTDQLVHRDLSVLFTVDRGISHEIVRHRDASFAQESTRYCNYGSKGGEITVIEPFYLMADGVKVSTENWSERYGAWVSACEEAEKSYLRMLADGSTPQEARAVLPDSLKTEIVMTANLREWRHFFSLRACGSTGKPHPQMLEVAVPLLKENKKISPVVFEDLEPMEV